MITQVHLEPVNKPVSPKDIRPDEKPSVWIKRTMKAARKKT